MYELFAQYLGTGKITLNPFPTNLTYGRKVFGKEINTNPELYFTEEVLAQLEECAKKEYSYGVVSNEIQSEI